MTMCTLTMWCSRACLCSDLNCVMNVHPLMKLCLSINMYFVVSMNGLLYHMIHVACLAGVKYDDLRWFCLATRRATLSIRGRVYRHVSRFGPAPRNDVTFCRYDKEEERTRFVVVLASRRHCNHGPPCRKDHHSSSSSTIPTANGQRRYDVRHTKPSSMESDQGNELSVRETQNGNRWFALTFHKSRMSFEATR